MVEPKRLMAVIAVLGALASPALAFQETTTGTGSGAPPEAAVVPDTAPPKTTAEPSKGLTLKVPEVSTGQGTEIRIPGIGTVGVLPKLDFGLELLYGASEGAGDAKGLPPDRNEPGDAQIRATIKHRF
jgi:hypothetical protein